MTSSITVRLTDEELQELKKHGRVSDVVRQALRYYLQSENRRKVIQSLRELQASFKIQTAIEDDLRLIREDRQR